MFFFFKRKYLFSLIFSTTFATDVDRDARALFTATSDGNSETSGNARNTAMSTLATKKSRIE